MRSRNIIILSILVVCLFSINVYASECTDSDGGHVYDSKGTVTYCEDTDTCEVYVDKCTLCAAACTPPPNPKCTVICHAVTEYYCEDGEVKEEEHVCVEEVCSDGICTNTCDSNNDCDEGYVCEEGYCLEECTHEGGLSLPPYNCCPGLDLVADCLPDEECPISERFCVDCGNGVCDLHENWNNCEEDCIEIECEEDDDCDEGFECVDNVCVEEEGEEDFCEDIYECFDYNIFFELSEDDPIEYCTKDKCDICPLDNKNCCMYSTGVGCIDKTKSGEQEDCVIKCVDGKRIRSCEIGGESEVGDCVKIKKIEKFPFFDNINLLIVVFLLIIYYFIKRKVLNKLYI